VLPSDYVMCIVVWSRDVRKVYSVVLLNRSPTGSPTGHDWSHGYLCIVVCLRILKRLMRHVNRRRGKLA
jgi:hypothetical protein